MAELLTSKVVNKPNKLCFRENLSTWYPIACEHPSILIPFNGHTHTSYLVPHKPGTADTVTLQEYQKDKFGAHLMQAAGVWWINLPLAGSSAADVCYVVIDCATAEAAAILFAQLVSVLASVDVARWGGALLAAGTNWNDTASDEQAIAARVRAALVANDATLAANARNVVLQARGVASGLVVTLERLLVDALGRSYDPISGTLPVDTCLGDGAAGGVGVKGVFEARRSGYWASRQGRRYTVKTPNITGVASVVGAFVATTPTYLLVNGSTNEMVVRRIKSICSNLNAATKRQMVIKTDTADRFSAGGTTRTPVTMNGGNVVAATQARSLEAATATAEGGGTRDVDVIGGKLAAGEPMIYEPEDGLIIPASGSLLVYNLSAGAATTEDVVIEYEDVNIQ